MTIRKSVLQESGLAAAKCIYATWY